MDTKVIFQSCISRAVKGIQSGGRVQVVEVPPTSSHPNRIIHLDPWRCPGTVSEYRESDYSQVLSPDKLRMLTDLVNSFQTMTQEFNPNAPVPEAEGKKADALILRINDIITQQSPAPLPRARSGHEEGEG